MTHLVKSFLRGLPVALLSLPVAAFADTVTFYNTGVAADGSLLAPGTLDPNYTLVYSDDPNATNAVVSSGNSAWGTSTSAGWITPGADGDDSVAQGYYSYEAIFDLTNYDPTTAVLSGCVEGDDWVGIYLNRNQSQQYFSYSDFTTPSCFSLSGNFTSGVNYIDFVVGNNSPGPSGLMVSDTSAYAQALPAQTPEPESLLLLSTGALGTVSILSKRRSR